MDLEDEVTFDPRNEAEGSSLKVRCGSTDVSLGPLDVDQDSFSSPESEPRRTGKERQGTPSVEKEQKISL